MGAVPFMTPAEFAEVIVTVGEGRDASTVGVLTEDGIRPALHLTKEEALAVAARIITLAGEIPERRPLKRLRAVDEMLREAE